MTQIERVPVDQVRDLIFVGTVLPFRVLDAQGRLLLNEGQNLSSERLFDMLMERGAWVDRALVEQTRHSRGGTGWVVGTAVRRETLFDHWEKSVWELDDITRRLARGKALASEIEDFSVRLVKLVERDVDIAYFSCVRQDDRRFALYALTHGLHTAVVGMVAAQQLGWAADRVMCLVNSALTMNVAMAELQAILAEQREPPDKRQLQQIREHPMASAQLLRAAGVHDANWLATVEDHHERSDGTGYPRAMTAVSELVDVLSAADVFMAKISPRALRSAIAPQLAIKQLFQQPGGAPLATALIRAVGIHPPGCLVQLASGEVAVVVRRPRSGTAPLVATLSNTQGTPVVDTHQRDTAKPEFAVQSLLADTSAFARVLPERVYGMVLA